MERQSMSMVAARQWSSPRKASAKEDQCEKGQCEKSKRETGSFQVALAF